MTLPSRSYDSPVRRARAERTRAHVVAVAERLFAERGYAGTSMRRIAAEAGVSLETVTQAGRKADLLLAAFQTRFAGVPDAVSLEGLLDPAVPGDPVDVAEALGAMIERVAERIRGSLGIWRAFTTAATGDTAVGTTRTELAAARRGEIAERMKAMEEAGVLPVHAPVERARLADAVGLIVSHDAYEHLVSVCGWQHRDYVAWATRAVLAQLSE